MKSFICHCCECYNNHQQTDGGVRTMVLVLFLYDTRIQYSHNEQDNTTETCCNAHFHSFSRNHPVQEAVQIQLCNQDSIYSMKFTHKLIKIWDKIIQDCDTTGSFPKVTNSLTLIRSVSTTRSFAPSILQANLRKKKWDKGYDNHL